jgi:hypothetical protein
MLMLQAGALDPLLLANLNNNTMLEPSKTLTSELAETVKKKNQGGQDEQKPAAAVADDQQGKEKKQKVSDERDGKAANSDVDAKPEQAAPAKPNSDEEVDMELDLGVLDVDDTPAAAEPKGDGPAGMGKTAEAAAEKELKGKIELSQSAQVSNIL